MTKRDSAPVGAPCWIDLFTSDQDKSVAFYTDLFGWTVDDPGPDYGGYKNFRKDGLMVAGSMRNDGQSGQPDAWSIYLTVDDAKEAVDAAAASGGQVIVPAMDVMSLGVMGVVADPGGAAIGLWQPGDHKGFGAIEEPGTPSWFELWAREYDAALDFYRNVFHWTTHTEGDTPEFRYTTLTVDGTQLAGVMDASAFLPEGMPGYWSVYFATADVDATLARTVELGGTVVQPAEDTPYGRLAAAADPTGAAFKLRSV